MYLYSCFSFNLFFSIIVQAICNGLWSELMLFPDYSTSIALVLSVRKIPRPGHSL